jgi:hypothetical protein
MVLMSTKISPGFALGHAAGAQRHLLHVGRVGDHREHHVAGRGHLGRAAGALRPGLQQRRHRLGAPRPHGEVETALEDVERHRAPHDAQTDETDFHELSLNGEKGEGSRRGGKWGGASEEEGVRKALWTLCAGDRQRKRFGKVPPLTLPLPTR